MKIKRPLILLSALCLCLCSTACGTKVRNVDNSTESSSQSSTAETTTTAETSAPEQSSSQAETTSSEKPEILEKIIIGNYVTYQEFSETKQAEQCKLSGDAKTAAEWLRKASEAGSGEATRDLALLYLNGEGVEADPAEAARLFERCAASGVSCPAVSPAQQIFGRSFLSTPAAARISSLQVLSARL